MAYLPKVRDGSWLYNKAITKLKTGAYKEAAVAFDEVDRQHPYYVWALSLIHI